MKRIICHPDNASSLPRYVYRLGFPVTTSHYIEKDQPTGRIIALDGTVADREGWEYEPDRFTVWEESDLPWLLRLGVVTEEREPLFYVVEDWPPLHRMPDPSPMTVMPIEYHLPTTMAY
jgi:hypothetical protein